MTTLDCIRYVFPIQAQRDWAGSALSKLNPTRTQGRYWAHAREGKARAHSKARRDRATVRSDHLCAVDEDEHAWDVGDWGVADESECGEVEPCTRQDQRRKHDMARRDVVAKRKAVREARASGMYSPSDRQVHEKAARVLKHRCHVRGGRQGPANEEEKIARKLKRKQGRQAGRRHK